MPKRSIRQRVRESFDRAAGTYDAAAVVQRRVCDRLLGELDHSSQATAEPTHILDAGCGTGYGARLLRSRWPGAQITGVDFAPTMLGLARHDTDFCFAADIERLPFGESVFDLWWSSLTIQWCNADTVFAEAARVLRPGGCLAISTLGPRTFAELRDAFSGIDNHRHTLPFNEPNAIKEALIGAGLRDVIVHREKHSVHYADLKTLLRSVKDIGAHNVGNGARAGMMGRDAWRNVEAAYERHRDAAGLPASYDVILGYARK